MSKGSKESVKTLADDVYAFPLSFAQQRLWFLQQLEPTSAAYSIPLAYRLCGLLDVTALRQSLDGVMRRHEILRTTFSVRDGEPVQIIHPALSLSLSIRDLRSLQKPQREESLQQVLLEDIRRPFDLDRGPLFRAGLIQTRDDEHVLLLNMHHIVSDEWSTRILFDELASLYRAYSNEAVPSLAELPIQYADYSVWQRDWLHGENLNTQLSYWKNRLDGVTAVNLPTDRPRPAIQTYSGSQYTIPISNQVCDQLKNLSRREGVTFFMTLLAAFHMFLHRYTGQDDVPVGTPIAGRTRLETEGLIGFFVNTLVMRPDLSGDPTAREFLARVRQVALAAYDHQDLPFERLVQELNPERDLSRSPLFQIMFAFQNDSENTFALSNLEVRRVPIACETVKVDLSVVVTERRDVLQLSFNYNTDLFDFTTIRRMADHFRTLLEGVASDPGRRISELPLLSNAEKHQLLVEWNETKREYPNDKCIHELFEEQVERTPEAVAVVFDDQQLTYRELNNRANQLAHYLRKRGVGPEVLVGVCVDRSPEMIIGLLAVLKAGGAYVPLDSEYPRARLAFMVEDARVGVLLTQQGVLERFPQRDVQVVCLDSDSGEISTESEENPNSEATKENLAYVIYTSGSTGSPKGVEVQHGSVVNFLNSMQQDLELTDKDTLLAVTTLSFDIFGLELYLPITAGARVVIVNREVAADAMELAKKITDARTTVMQATPVTWRMLLDGGWGGSKSLRILCGGEAMTRELAELLLARAPSVWNMYGPTETTIWSTLFQVSSGVGVIPLGRPIANTQIYILDQYRAVVPIGVAGEIYVGGDGLARGYLNRPELTAEKFIYHSFDGAPAQRLYKTGDLARYLPDGNIEYLGRLDDQVKIRGFRVELGEIEAVISQHPAVQQAIVIVREDAPGDRRLVAYIVENKGTSAEAPELRAYLKNKLPDYMVPSAFVFMDAVPLTPNGKIDRSKLPMPESSQRSKFVAPRTPVEQNIAEIWAKVLRVDRVGIDDNFFDLGGHSLLATQVISRMRGVFNYDIPLRSLFEAPTVEDLAMVIIRQQAEKVSNTEMERLLDDVEAVSGEMVRAATKRSQ